MKTKQRLLSNRNVAGWLALVSAVALHVFDEAMTGFLPFYNQLVIDMRERLNFFPAPTFTFKAWLGGLIAAILIGYLLTPLVARSGRVIRVVTIVLGILMLGNALGHVLGSVYSGRILPGMWSSPVLLLAAAFVILQGFLGEWQGKITK